jgi:hypothetical protein
MISYKITITGDRYPTEYTVEASGWGTAVARAIRQWKQRFKGSRTDTLSIRAVKVSQSNVKNSKKEEEQVA